MSTPQLLPQIMHHEKLPGGAKEIARITEQEKGNSTLVFVKYQRWLILVVPSDFLGYHTTQFEVPLGFLDWFPKALKNFRASPSEGGLPAGRVSTADQTVEGEILCIQRNMGDRDWPHKGEAPGYAVLNRSRPDPNFTLFERASEISFSEQFLYQGGLMDLIERLGNQYKAGFL